MKEITLRQIEIIRAVVLCGTISGAAKHLGVSAPGVSRLLKHTEESLGLKLFDRRAGLFIPSVDAERVFDQIGDVFKGVENLQHALSTLKKGDGVELAFASAPSVAQFVAARVLQRVRQRYPDLFINLNILKIEETLDYILLERGEFVIMSSPIKSPNIINEELAEGDLAVITPIGHPLAQKAEISVLDLVNEPLIGTDPDDPYGAILATPFRKMGLEPKHSIRGRFAQTVVSLVRHGLGVAIIDSFSISEVYMPDIERRPLKEAQKIKIYGVTKKGRRLSSFAEDALRTFRHELNSARAHGVPAAPSESPNK
jgi:DNA-binding transcriptional LysR family regulator